MLMVSATRGHGESFSHFDPSLEKPMSAILNWDHKWFGLWKEFGRGYEKCPSIHDFIDKKISASYDQEHLIRYLENAHIIVTTSRMSFPCVITGKIFDGPLSERTDGLWWWRDDLGYYIKNHNLCIPAKMLDAIVQNNYTPPTVTREQIAKLERCSNAIAIDRPVP
jgi:hypothetical protein